MCLYSDIRAHRGSFILKSRWRNLPAVRSRSQLDGEKESFCCGIRKFRQSVFTTAKGFEVCMRSEVCRDGQWTCCSVIIGELLKLYWRLFDPILVTCMQRSLDWRDVTTQTNL